MLKENVLSFSVGPNLDSDVSLTTLVSVSDRLLLFVYKISSLLVASQKTLVAEVLRPQTSYTLRCRRKLRRQFFEYREWR